MRKTTFILILLVIISVALFYINFIGFGKNSYTNDNFEKTNDNSDGSEAGIDTGVGKSSGAGGGGGGGGSGSGYSETGISSSGENENIDGNSSCTLIRPGNLPNIECSVNYIKKDGVSLKIINELGEDMDVKISLEKCSPEFLESIQNSHYRDFVFLCGNSEIEHFNSDIYISYILNQGKIVEIGGFIDGDVQ